MAARQRQYRSQGPWGPKPRVWKPQPKPWRAARPPLRRSLPTQAYLGIETKFYDTTFTGAIVSPTDATAAECDPATVLTLSAPAQGDGQSDRDGRKIMVKSVQLSGTVSTVSQAYNAEVAPIIYIALVLDKQSNGAQLNSEDVFTNPSGLGTQAASPLRDMAATSRFQVLAVKRFPLPVPSISWDGGAATNVIGTSVPFEIYKKLEIPVLFSSTTAGVSNVTDNSLHVIAYCNTAALAPTLNYNARIRFVG